MQGLGGTPMVTPHMPIAPPPREVEALWLTAWAAGQTGLPYVDACMRYLAATGWLNFQARATVVAFAAQHLRLDWRAIGTVLARRLTDYEPTIHWPQVQIHSGVAAGPPPRPCNPVRHGQAQDPTGVFTRRWVPELAKVPDVFLHEPWKWHSAADLLRRPYPEPLVPPTTSARSASRANCTAGVGLTARASAPRRPATVDQLSLDL